MGIPNISASASSSASSGPSKSGDILGGTAFNIGGINFGTADQGATAATPVPQASFVNPSSALYWIGGALLIGAVILLTLKKRR